LEKKLFSKPSRFLNEIKTSIHKDIHRKKGGGPWNQDLNKFLKKRPNAEVMFEFAAKMLQTYGQQYGF